MRIRFSASLRRDRLQPIEEVARTFLRMLAMGILGVASGVETYAFPPPGGAGWRVLAFERVSRQTVYERVEVDGLPALRARASCSASAILHAAPDLDLARTPRLHWRWRVDRDQGPRDPRARSGDDFAARVYVAFRFVPDRASVWERLKRGALGVVYGGEMPGSALNYVWSASEPARTVWPSPYTAQSRMISLGAGTPGSFHDAAVDVRADYLRVFGVEPPPVEFVALMSDADDGCGETLAWFASLYFSSE